MIDEFIDTNILIYAHDSSAGARYRRAGELLNRLIDAGIGALSTQVMVEFYAAATRKLKMTSEAAEAILMDLAIYTVHRPAQADLIRAAGIQRRYKISWWDALIVNSALEVNAAVLWSEDLADGQRYRGLTVRNPFR